MWRRASKTLAETSIKTRKLRKLCESSSYILKSIWINFVYFYSRILTTIKIPRCFFLVTYNVAYCYENQFSVATVVNLGNKDYKLLQKFTISIAISSVHDYTYCWSFSVGPIKQFFGDMFQFTLEKIFYLNGTINS